MLGATGGRKHYKHAVSSFGLAALGAVRRQPRRRRSGASAHPGDPGLQRLAIRRSSDCHAGCRTAWKSAGAGPHVGSGVTANLGIGPRTT